MHEHPGCPHDGEEVDLPIHDEPDGDEGMTPEVAEIIAEAAVEVAQIEADVEEQRIEAEIEHHEIEAHTEQAQIDASLEHHHIEADADDELEEEIEVLEELVEEMQGALDEPMAQESVDADSPDMEDDLGEGGGAVSVAPPPRVEAPSGVKKKPRRQSAFSARHTRRH